MSAPRRPEAAQGGPLRAWLLGPNLQMQPTVRAMLVVLLLYVACCGVAGLAERHQLIRPGFPLVLVAMVAATQIPFLIAVRSGWSRRFKDPHLLLPQNVASLAIIAIAYTQVVPDHRGLLFMLVTLVVVFSTYSLLPRQAVFVSVLAAAMLGAATWVMSRINPAYYPAAYEIPRFELLVGVLLPLALTAQGITRIRHALANERRELRAALERVQQLATRDALTGLVNRRHMQTLLDQAGAAAAADPALVGPAFCVALIDLDHFKRINDSHGHRVGDEVLRGFGRTALRVLRPGDVIARWGGEEFLVLFPRASLGQARQTLRHLAVLLQEEVLSADVPALRVRFSAGLAVHSARHTLAHTLERADRVLYTAKAEGRNCARVARDTLFGGDSRLDDAPASTGGAEDAGDVEAAGHDAGPGANYLSARKSS